MKLKHKKVQLGLDSTLQIQRKIDTFNELLKVGREAKLTV